MSDNFLPPDTSGLVSVEFVEDPRFLMEYSGRPKMEIIFNDRGLQNDLSGMTAGCLVVLLVLKITGNLKAVLRR